MAKTTLSDHVRPSFEIPGTHRFTLETYEKMYLTEPPENFWIRLKNDDLQIALEQMASAVRDVIAGFE